MKKNIISKKSWRGRKGTHEILFYHSFTTEFYGKKEVFKYACGSTTQGHKQLQDSTGVLWQWLGL